MNTNLILGKANSGKTRGILLPTVKKSIELEESLVILDNKCEYYESFGQLLKDNNYNTYILNLEDTTKTNGFNPLSLPYYYYKNNNKDKSLDLIKDLGKNIFNSDVNGDPFWVNTSADYFTSLVLILFENGKEEEINLGSVAMTLSLADKMNGEKTLIQEYVSKLDILNPIYLASSGTVFAPFETKSSILCVIREKLNNYIMKENLLNALCINEIDLTNIKEKTAIFIIIEEETKNIANIILNQIFEISKTQNKFTFILDGLDKLNEVMHLKFIIENNSRYQNKFYISYNSKEEFNKQYNDLFDKFNDILEITEAYNLQNFGSYKEYPQIEFKKHQYFNFEDLK
ncbi:MAG: type IV secretory system conjugative DNA transfer family protein [Mycoplasmatota bacterium]